MEMLNRCLDVTSEMQEALKKFDERKEMIFNRIEERSELYGSRKERRRQAAIERVKQQQIKVRA